MHGLSSLATQSVVPSSAALASPGIWLEMQTFRLHPTPTEPESGF